MHPDKYLDDQADYPLVRSVLSENYAGLPDNDLEQLYFDLTDGGDIEDYENFLKSLSRFGNQAGQALGQAAPGMIQGALAGATTGAALGPYGALAGGLLGAVGGGVQSYQAANRRPPAPPRQPQAAPATPVPTAARPAATSTLPSPAAASPPAPTPTPPPPPPPPPPPTLQQQVHAINPGIAPTVHTPNAALATTLAAFLQRPETLQAIASLMAGQLGRRTVPVGNVPVPTESFLLTIESLARNARSAAATDAADLDAVAASHDDTMAADLIERMEQANTDTNWFDTPDDSSDWVYTDEYEDSGEKYVSIDTYDPNIFVDNRLELG